MVFALSGRSERRWCAAAPSRRALVLGGGFAHACAAPVAPSLGVCSEFRIVTAGAVGRPPTRTASCAPAAPMLAAGVRSRAGAGPGATRWCAPHVTPCAAGRCAPCARRAMLGSSASRRSLVCGALCGCPVLNPPHHRRGGGSPPASWPGFPVLRCLSPPQPGCRPGNHRANPARVVTLLAAASPPPLTVRCAH